MSHSKAYEDYIDWVRDAHAMEEQAEAMLKKMADRLEHYPVLQEGITRHITETQDQQRLVKSVLDRLDTSSSTFKDVAGKVAAAGQAFGGMFASDEVIKGSISGYVFEHLEIASYTNLIAAAEAVGDLEGAKIFLQIKKQEEAMAAWLSEHSPAVTKEYLARLDNPDQESKR